MSGFRYSSGDRPLDGYTIEHALGRGGFGEVYFAKSDAGREVALKVIQNYEDIELRGVSHCMNLKSPHLVTIFDVKHDSGKRPWVVMEYVAGPCLKELLDEAAGDIGNANERAKGIGEDQAMYFMRELIKGMRYLHDSGVVHRDLKPHNIFFEDGNVKIGDYSLSKAISSSHRSGHTTTVGSVHYMAPEIGEGKYGKAVDIYALGVILFELLTGNPPYVGESMGEVLIKHLTSKPDVEGLNPVFGRVITKAMARKPEDRFQSVDEMLHALCPEDHSSYLPAPASLSMIGDRAAGRKSKPPVQMQPVGIEDTFVRTPSLVDTREDSQSQPFERPGVIVPDSLPVWLHHAGLWWQPTSESSHEGLVGGDSVSYLKRAIMAILVSWCFALLATVNWPLEPLVGIILFPAVGFAASWAFLQMLPRDNSQRSKVVNRLVGAGVVGCIGVLVYLITFPINYAAQNFGPPDGFLLALMLGGLLIDWRCFISAHRYPRVGIIKTLTVFLSFILALALTATHGDRSVLTCLMMIMAATLSVQILAPHGRIGDKVRGELSSAHSNAEPLSKDEDLQSETPLSETRFEPESFSLKEEV